MNLSYTISADRRSLTIRADDEARAELRSLKAETCDADDCGEWGTDRMMEDIFEQLICNSELEWIRPETCYDLTDAPILGILGTEEEAAQCTPAQWEAYRANRNGSGIQYDRPVIERWGYLSYAMRSPLDDLLDRGEAGFTAP